MKASIVTDRPPAVLSENTDHMTEKQFRRGLAALGLRLDFQKHKVLLALFRGPRPLSQLQQIATISKRNLHRVCTGLLKSDCIRLQARIRTSETGWIEDVFQLSPALLARFGSIDSPNGVSRTARQRHHVQMIGRGRLCHCERCGEPLSEFNHVPGFHARLCCHCADLLGRMKGE